nr:FAD-binding oxidoreductase [uncultured Lichenicoccus sp.]
MKTSTGFERRWVLQAAAAAMAASSLPLRVEAAAPVDLSSLRRHFRGTLIGPESAGYDRERRCFTFNPNTDKHPVVIAKCSGEDDIAACMDFAGSKGLDIAIRSGGHDFLGASTGNGILIDTRPMASCQLSASRTAIVGAGAKTGEVTKFLQPSSRAVPFGDSAGVGVGGLTLGGGIGWLAGKYGATCDNLVRARLVLADGRRVVASEEENPDLFWAIRGGGGNFGIVTQFEYGTVEIETVLAGYALYAARDIGGFLRFYRDYISLAPDELAVEIGVVQAEQTLITAHMCWSGDVKAGRKVLAPLLAYGSPLAVDISERPYGQVSYMAPSIKAILHPQPVGTAKGVPPSAQQRGGSLGAVSDAAIHALTERIGTARGNWSFSLVHYLHGAICRTPPAKTALTRPLGSFSYHFNAEWSDDDQTTHQMEWVKQSGEALGPYSIPTYVNYLSSGKLLDVKRTYGDNFARLQSIKQRYDPNNIFHNNRNIPPAE